MDELQRIGSSSSDEAGVSSGEQTAYATGTHHQALVVDPVERLSRYPSSTRSFVRGTGSIQHGTMSNMARVVAGLQHGSVNYNLGPSQPLRIQLPPGSLVGVDQAVAPNGCLAHEGVQMPANAAALGGAHASKTHVRALETVDRKERLKRQSRHRRESTEGTKYNSDFFPAHPRPAGKRSSAASSRPSGATEVSGTSTTRVSLTPSPEASGQPSEQKQEALDRRRSSSVGACSQNTRHSREEPRRSSTSSSSPRWCCNCEAKFTRLLRPHMCRLCRQAVCAACSPARVSVPTSREAQRACRRCAGASAPRIVAVVSPRTVVAPQPSRALAPGGTRRSPPSSVGSAATVRVAVRRNAVAKVRPRVARGVRAVDDSGGAGGHAGSSTLVGGKELLLTTVSKGPAARYPAREEEPSSTRLPPQSPHPLLVSSAANGLIEDRVRVEREEVQTPKMSEPAARGAAVDELGAKSEWTSRRESALEPTEMAATESDQRIDVTPSDSDGEQTIRELMACRSTPTYASRQLGDPLEDEIEMETGSASIEKTGTDRSTTGCVRQSGKLQGATEQKVTQETLVFKESGPLALASSEDGEVEEEYADRELPASDLGTPVMQAGLSEGGSVEGRLKGDGEEKALLVGAGASARERGDEEHETLETEAVDSLAAATSSRGRSEEESCPDEISMSAVWETPGAEKPEAAEGEPTTSTAASSSSGEERKLRKRGSEKRSARHVGGCGTAKQSRRAEENGDKSEEAFSDGGSDDSVATERTSASLSCVGLRDERTVGEEEQGGASGDGVIGAEPGGPPAPGRTTTTISRENDAGDGDSSTALPSASRVEAVQSDLRVDDHGPRAATKGQSHERPGEEPEAPERNTPKTSSISSDSIWMGPDGGAVALEPLADKRDTDEKDWLAVLQEVFEKATSCCH